MDLGVVDFIILVIVVASAIYGAFKGFISQLVSILSLILGTWCAFKFSPVVANYIKGLFPAGETVIYIISFIIILLIMILICTFIGKAIEKIVTFSLLGWLNRLLGILFAAAKSLIILSLIVFILNYLDRSWNILPDSLSANSLFYPQLTMLSERIYPHLQSLIP